MCIITCPTTNTCAQIDKIPLFLKSGLCSRLGPACCAWQGCCFNAASFCPILHPLCCSSSSYSYNLLLKLMQGCHFLTSLLNWRVKKMQCPVQCLLETLTLPSELHLNPKSPDKSTKHALMAWSFQISVHSSAVGVQEGSCLQLREGAWGLLGLSLYQESQTTRDCGSCSASSTECSLSARLRGWRGLSSLLHHLLGSAKSLNLNQFQREWGQNFRGDLNSS